MFHIKRTFAENYEKVKRTLMEDYEIISWLLRIFVGGALNIVFLNALSTFITNNVQIANGAYQSGVLFTPELFPSFAALFAIVLASPFAISLCLTKREPNIRIVPPFWIAIIGIIWTVIFWFSPNPSVLFAVALFDLVLVSAARLEDGFITSIVGVATEREAIYFEHLRVYAEIANVKARLSIPAIMNTLNLSEAVDDDNEQGCVFHMKGGFDYANIISLTKDKEYPEITNLKVVYYEKARYNLRSSPNLIEHSTRTSAYLLEILIKRKPELPFEVVSEFTNDASDPMIDSMIDELHGYYARYKRLPARDSVKVLGLVIIALLTLILFLTNQPAIYWQLSILFDVFIYLSELVALLRRRK